MATLGPASVTPAAAAASDSATVERGASGVGRGPPTETVAELLRTLELTITGRLDGVLHGHYQGLTPGHGSEPGESRLYQPGDDVRRIDWNITAAHARDPRARTDRRPRPHGLAGGRRVGDDAVRHRRQRQGARSRLAAAACVGFLTARNQNRLGAVLVAGPVDPRRATTLRVRTRSVPSCRSLSRPARSPREWATPTSRARSTGSAAIANRRGFVAVISDFRGDDWQPSLARLSLRHDLLAITVADPREHDVPPIGLVELVDPATGAIREVRVTAKVQQRFAAAAQEERDRAAADALGRTRADVIELSTDSDWLGAIVQHIQRRRVQAVRGDGIGR